MDIRGLDWTSNVPCCLDLLRRHLWFFLGLLIGLDSRPHPRIAGCRGDDLFMAVGSGSGSICDLSSFRRSSRVIDLHRRIRRHHRNRNDLVVACSEQQVLKWTIGAGDWELVMFCTAPAHEWQRKYHDLASSAQSRQ